MNFSLSTWVGEVTTAHGAMILGPTLLAVASGTMSWPSALPLLVAGVVGLLWPENIGLKTAAQKAADDVETLIAAYRTGLRHGADGNSITTASAVAAPGASISATAIALLASAAMALAACGNQSSTQQAAAGAAIASGLICLADASGKVVSTAATNDPDAVKAVNSAVAAGNVLLTDSACRQAMNDGVLSLSNTPAMP